MKNFKTTMMCSGLLLLGTQVFAAEPMASDSKNNTATMAPDQMAKQDAMMKDCMTRQKAMSATMSSDDMTKACKSEMKMKHDEMMKKDGMSKDGMSKDNMSKDGMKK